MQERVWVDNQHILDIAIVGASKISGVLEDLYGVLGFWGPTRSGAVTWLCRSPQRSGGVEGHREQQPGPALGWQGPGEGAIPFPRAEGQERLLSQSRLRG